MRNEQVSRVFMFYISGLDIGLSYVERWFGAFFCAGMVIENGKLPLVPQIQVGGGSEKGCSNGLVEMLLTMLASDKVAQLKTPVVEATVAEQAATK